ncbi:YfbM family protein [Streptomyces sp. NPDC055055]
MNGEYLRVTAAELERALTEPEWALEFAEAIQDAQDDDQTAAFEARHFTTHQTWHFLSFLLHRSAFPVDIVHGEETIVADDWGYGPPRYLTPDRVGLAASTLRRMSYDRLVLDVDPAELVKAEIYPQIWDAPAALDWASDVFTPLTEFFQGAAAAGDAVLIWID